VQGILGPDAVVTGVVGGGRSVDDQVRLVPWGDERTPARPGPPSTGAADPSVVVVRGPSVVVVPQRAAPTGPSPPARTEGQRRATGALARRPAGTVARRAPDPAAGLPPWPGRLPQPAPALVLPQPLPAVVHDAAGEPVRVSARLELTGAPALLLVGTAAPVEITGWAGPWPVDERWWAPAEARRRARFQVALADGRALLLSLTRGQWLVEAIYD
jgi:protein ImuB